MDFGPLQESITTNVAGDGSVSTEVKEEIAELGLKAVGAGDGDGDDASPVNFSGRAEKAIINLGVEGFKSRKAFDLWGLLAAYPARADLAAHEVVFKSLLQELAAPGLKLTEGIDAQKTVVTASLGAIALGDFKYQLGAVNAGPQSAINFSVSADGLSLPVGLLPPNASALTPSKVDVAATLKGINIAAAANEWISDLRLQGDGPLLSDDNAEKVETAFISSGPVQIEFAPSHIVAPAVDAEFAGLIRLDHSEADRGDHDPRAELRQDDGGGQRFGAGHRRPGHAGLWRWPRGSARARATAVSAGSWSWIPGARSRSTGSRLAGPRTKRPPARPSGLAAQSRLTRSIEIHHAREFSSDCKEPARRAGRARPAAPGLGSPENLKVK